MTPDAAEVIIGGPMMGQAQPNLDAPVIKGTTGVVVLEKHETRAGEGRTPASTAAAASRPARCSSIRRCSATSPAWRATTRWRTLHLADCMLCGSCSYVCPSNIPLSQLFQASKAALRRAKAGAA